MSILKKSPSDQPGHRPNGHQPPPQPGHSPYREEVQDSQQTQVQDDMQVGFVATFNYSIVSKEWPYRNFALMNLIVLLILICIFLSRDMFLGSIFKVFLIQVQ